MSDGGPTASERFVNGIIPENPVYRQLLGLCPVLAVTAGLQPAMTMAGATAFVLISANVIVAMIRHLLKPHLRILVFTLTIATFVTLVDRFLAAYMWEMSKTLGPYVPLIICNCLIISRCEICASRQSVGVAFADAIGMSLGFALALASIAAMRELLGSGALFGIGVLPEAWPGWGVMILPPGAFLAMGILLGMSEGLGMWRAARRRRLERRKEEKTWTPSAA